MPEALEVINNVLAQHGKITEHVKVTGDKMNDIDAIFNIQQASYKVAWSASSLPDLIQKREELLQKVEILEEGLTKHFNYEEQVFPLVLGAILVKDILGDHKKIFERIAKLKAALNSNLEGLKEDEVLAMKTDLMEGVNILRDSIVNHAHAEENILGLIKKVFEDYKNI